MTLCSHVISDLKCMAPQHSFCFLKTFSLAYWLLFTNIYICLSLSCIKVKHLSLGRDEQILYHLIYNLVALGVILGNPCRGQELRTPRTST